MKEPDEQLAERMIEAQLQTNHLLGELIATMQDQVRAIDELCASNDQMMIELGKHADESGEAGPSRYMDGTPV